MINVMLQRLALHATNRFSPVLGACKTLFQRLTERAIVTDPGLMRMRNAARATLSTALTGVVLIAWANLDNKPMTLAGLGILFALISPLFLRDATNKGWLTSLIALYSCSTLAFIVASRLSLGPSEIIANIGFIIVLFIGMLAQACGPRALGCALLSAVTYYLGLYLHLTTAPMLESLAGSLLAPFAVYLVARILLPTNAALTIHRATQTIVQRAWRVVRLSEHCANTPHKGLPFAIQRSMTTLNDAALALEAHLSLFDVAERDWPRVDQLRERLVQLELAAGRVVSDFVDSQNDTRLIIGTSLSDLRATITSLHQYADAWRRQSPLPLMPRPRPMQETLIAKAQRFASNLAWLPAMRMTTAALLAMSLGYAISPQRWYWAVVTVFVVFLGTRSRADTIYRGLERVIGTFAGAAVCVIVAPPLHTHPILLTAVMLACAFGWAHSILNAYGRGVFFITTIVGLTYAELGFAIVPLVEMRLQEVLLGCAIAFAVAYTVAPITAARHIDDRMNAWLRQLRAHLMLCSVSLVHAEENTVGINASIRSLDRAWQDLHLALRPFQTQRVFAWHPDHEQLVGTMSACAHQARLIGATIAKYPFQAQQVPVASVGALQNVTSRLDQLIDAHTPTSRDTIIDNAPPSVLLSAIGQLDAGLSQLAQRWHGPLAV